MCVCVCVCVQQRAGRGVCVYNRGLGGVCVCVCSGGGTCFLLPVFWLGLLRKCHAEAALSLAGGEKEGSPLPWTSGCSPGDRLYSQSLCLSVELGWRPFS